MEFVMYNYEVSIVINITVFWDVMPFSLVGRYYCIKGICCLHLQGRFFFNGIFLYYFEPHLHAANYVFTNEGLATESWLFIHNTGLGGNANIK